MAACEQAQTLAANQAAYAAAEKLEADGDVTAAYDAFIALGEYSDSAARAKALETAKTYADAEALMAEGLPWAFLTGDKDPEGVTLNLSLPKFDVRSQIDLIQGMQELGVTDVFDPACADFSPMTDTAGVCASAMNHAGRVVIDEEGVIAAAFTVFLFGGGMPQELKEINFTLDRPFLFIVSSQDRLPLFAGTVVAL